MSDRIIKKSVLVLILVLLLFSSVVYAEVEESTSTMVGSQKEWVVINKVSSWWNGRLFRNLVTKHKKVEKLNI